MSLEAGGYISDLVSSNPPGTDRKSEGDNHIRLIKAALQQTFPNANKVFRFPASVASYAGNYSVTFPDDYGKIIPINALAAARFVSLPAPSGVNADGFCFTVVKADHSNNTVSVSGTANNVNGEAALVLHQRFQRADFYYSSANDMWYVQLEQIPPIGSIVPYGGLVAPTGWLLCSQRNIGNAASSANSLAAEWARGLFYHLWSNYPDSVCPVSAGRGASAQSDFDGGKTIGLVDMRSRVWLGKSDMDGVNNGLLGTIITGTQIGAEGGTETVTLNVSQMPAHGHSVTVTENAHAHASGGGLVGAGSNAGAAGGSFTAVTGPAANPAVAATVTGVSVSVASAGAGAAHSNLPPSRIGSYIIKY